MFLGFSLNIYFTSSNFLLALTALLALQEISAINIECQFLIFSEDSDVLLGKNFNITEQNTSVTTINNLSARMFGPIFVEQFSIEDQIVNFMPKGLENFFPELEMLVVQNSKLKSIKKIDLQIFADLEYLNLKHNNLKALDGDLFEGNRNLMIIDFSGNRLMFIGNQLLVPLKNIKHAYFSDNNCIDDFATIGSVLIETRDISILQNELKENCPDLLKLEKLKNKSCKNPLKNLRVRTEKEKLNAEKLELKSKLCMYELKLMELRKQFVEEKDANYNLKIEVDELEDTLRLINEARNSGY